MSQTPRTDEILRLHRECMSKLATPANEHVLAARVLALETELAAMQERAGKAEAQAQKLLEDAERWAEVEHRMVHQHSGPNVGWTLDGLLPGDSPTEAIDAARRKL